MADIPREANQHLTEIFNAALAAVDPYHAVLNAASMERNRLHLADKTYDLAAYERIVVIGAGKATARMALAIEALLGSRVAAGLIIVKDGHTAPLSFIEQVESSHPVPGAAGVAATERILEIARTADDKTLLIALISGGASALLIAPVVGVTLQDKQESTRLLLNAGASISELNAVRKHLSQVKGGRLAQAAYPAQVVTLIVSDVIGDPLDVIASGPTAPDASTFDDAWAVVKKYHLQEKLPPRVVDHLQRGIQGQTAETVKVHDPCLNKTRNIIVARIHLAMAAAHEKATQLLSRHELKQTAVRAEPVEVHESVHISTGSMRTDSCAGSRAIVARIVFESLQGEAREAARSLAQATRAELAAMQPGERRCLLWGGETTVTLRGTGLGGRNQELALAFALEIAGCSGVTLLSAGTDGTDGPTDAAGAIIDGSTAAAARSHGIDPQRYLDNNNSYAFFQRLDAATGAHSHFKTGTTGTNVMDIQIVLLDKPLNPPT